VQARLDEFDAWLEQSEPLQIHGYRRILHVVPDDLSLSATFRRKLKEDQREGADL
jgi:predicted TIM-barrel fold metal-dependent hydrolase